MNANIKRTPRRRKDVPPSTPFGELPLSGANTEDETGRSVEPDPNSVPPAAEPVQASPSNVGVRPATVGADLSTALTVPERARIALKSEQTERDFQAMVEKSKDIALITNADGRTQCHAMLMDYVRARTTLEASDKEARAELVAVNTAIIAERKRLAEIIEVEEKRLRAVRDAWDAKIAEEKRLKAEAEQRRVQAINNRIEEIRATREDAIGKKATEIAEIIAIVEAIAIDETFAELKLQADSAKSMTLGKLRYLHTAATSMEAEAKRLQEVRERLDREKIEQDAAAAKERERAAEESRKAEEARQQRELALDAIRVIRDRVHMAAEGDSLEAYDLALSVTQGEAITEERFGALVETALTAQSDTLETLRQRRAALEKRLADEVELARQRDEQEAENARINAQQEAAAKAERERLAEAGRRIEAQRKEQEEVEVQRRQVREAEERRIADERAALERDQAALRAQQEAAAAPAPTPPPEVLEPVVERTVPALVTAIDSEFAYTKPPRPSDEAIVAMLARGFSVERETVVDWLCDMDLPALVRSAA